MKTAFQTLGLCGGFGEALSHDWGFPGGFASPSGKIILLYPGEAHKDMYMKTPSRFRLTRKEAYGDGRAALASRGWIIVRKFKGDGGSFWSLAYGKLGGSLRQITRWAEFMEKNHPGELKERVIFHGVMDVVDPGNMSIQDVLDGYLEEELLRLRPSYSSS